MSEINIFGAPGYETYIIDGNTVGVRPKWTSVEDALPVKEGYYLCFSTYGGGMVDTWYWWKEGHFASQMEDDNDPDPRDDITHWMPLPEFP